MSGSKDLAVWQRWLRQPQKLWLRRALFQAHLWSGIAVGLYILMISVTGSVLVYSNELYRAATAKTVVSRHTGPRMAEAQIAAAARRIYPGYQVSKIVQLAGRDEAVDVWLTRGHQLKKRLFDPWTGRDLGDSVPLGIWLISKLIDLHDNLFAGPAGRKVNGIGGVAVLVLSFTGLAIWWPGTKTWRRSLVVPRGVGWKRGLWHWHSMIGFWSFGFTVVFGLSGIYLAYPDWVQDLADRLQPPTAANAGTRVVDRVIYWLAYLHFGRICGIGIPCKGPGFCDQSIKALWALFGLAPAAMFVTGAMLWWNRVLQPRIGRARRPRRADRTTALKW